MKLPNFFGIPFYRFVKVTLITISKKNKEYNEKFVKGKYKIKMKQD